MANLKSKAKMSYGCATGANWRDNAAPIQAGAGNAPPVPGPTPKPPKYKAAYAGNTTGIGQMRHTSFYGRR